LRLAVHLVSRDARSSAARRLERRPCARCRSDSVALGRRGLPDHSGPLSRTARLRVGVVGPSLRALERCTHRRLPLLPPEHHPRPADTGPTIAATGRSRGLTTPHTVLCCLRSTCQNQSSPVRSRATLRGEFSLSASIFL